MLGKINEDNNIYKESVFKIYILYYIVDLKMRLDTFII